jgi:hypothetical protein
MAYGEYTTDVPEHAGLEPKVFWDRRARGLGASPEAPVVSCAEENMLAFPGDPYSTENILIHEFAHVVHAWGVGTVDPAFDGRLQAAYEHAQSNGLWKGTYAMQNRAEYWAEGTQSWFDTNRADDHDHGPVDTRAEVKAHDPGLVRLLAEVYGDGPWRYRRPEDRPAEERAHLAGLDVSKLPAFRWPDRAVPPEKMGRALAWMKPDELPRASPRSEASETAVSFVNRRAKPVQVEWVDFAGGRRHYATVRPGLSELLTTFPGHVWMISEDGVDLGGAVAAEREGRVVIR